MPFPLAHPAAVLPLKRWCPRWLNLPGLILGSLSPDTAYLFGKLNLDQISHKFWGLFAFCLPAGLMATLVLYMLRASFADLLPEKWRRVLLPQTWHEAGSLLGITLSVLLGAATHLAWDSLTHQGGWVVERIPFLEMPVASFAGHNVRICRVLWYGSSFVGIAVVYLIYRHALLRVESPSGPTSRRLEWLQALLLAALVVPIELVHDLLRTPAGSVIVASLSLLLVLGVVWLNSASISPQPGLESPAPAPKSPGQKDHNRA